MTLHVDAGSHARRHAVSAFSSGAAAVVMIVAASALTGILTTFGQQLLPHSIRSMANSSGPWMLITFVLIYLSGVRGRYAALMGAISFVTMDLSFYVVFELLGKFYPHHYLAFWMFIGVAIGPLIGICASWLRDKHPVRRALGVAAPASVLMGEGAYMLVRLPGESTVYAIASVAVGVLLLVGLVAWRLREARSASIGIALAIVGAVAFFFIYGLIPLLLHTVVP
jgi:hypothetical protein